MTHIVEKILSLAEENLRPEEQASVAASLLNMAGISRITFVTLWGTLTEAERKRLLNCIEYQMGDAKE